MQSAVDGEDDLVGRGRGRVCGVAGSKAKGWMVTLWYLWVKRSALAGNSGLIPGNNSPVITVPQAMVVIALVVLRSYFISNLLFFLGPDQDPSQILRSFHSYGTKSVRWLSRIQDTDI